MFKEILKIIPRIESGDLSRMEKSLNTRFNKIAKRFGSGLKAALVGGGVTALAVGVIDKLLNPLKETEQVMKNLLGRSDDLETFANQFGTSALNLFKLEQLGKVKGIEPEELRVMLTKFQSAVAEAVADPSKVTAVRNFARPGQDNAEAFLQFIRALQRATPEQRTLAQNEIFGEKQTGKMAELMQEKDFEQILLNSGVQGIDPVKFSKAIQRAAALEEESKLQASRRESVAFATELEMLNKSMIDASDSFEQNRLAKEIRDLGQFNRLKQAQIGQDLIVDSIGIAFQKYVLPSMAPMLQALGVYMKKTAGSRLLKGFNPEGK